MPRVRLRRPRRGKLDSKDHLWFGEYWAGRLGVFDPTKGNIKEYALGPEVEPFGAAYTACYSASPDDNNHIVWTMDTNSGRIYKSIWTAGNPRNIYAGVLRTSRYCGRQNRRRAADIMAAGLSCASQDGEGAGLVIADYLLAG
jgi:hypothetical protein